MIEVGPTNHGIRARRLSTAFARLRAFLERCTDGREAVFVRKASKSRLQQLIEQITAGLMPAPCPC